MSHARPIDIPPCDHSPDDCPPIEETAMTETAQRLSRECDDATTTWHPTCRWPRCECECHDDRGDFDIDNI